MQLKLQQISAWKYFSSTGILKGKNENFWRTILFILFKALYVLMPNYIFAKLQLRTKIDIVDVQKTNFLIWNEFVLTQTSMIYIVRNNSYKIACKIKRTVSNIYEIQGCWIKFSISKLLIEDGSRNLKKNQIQQFISHLF